LDFGFWIADCGLERSSSKIEPSTLYPLKPKAFIMLK
jgi:hypothetical protein